MDVYVENCTKDPRTMTARSGPGMLMFPLAGGEVKPIDELALKKLRTNPAVEKLFSAKLVRIIPKPEPKVATPIKANPLPLPKAKPKKRRSKKTKTVDIGI